VTRRDGHGDWRGRVWTMVLDGTRSDVTVSGDSFRSRFGLRSSWFAFSATAITARWAAVGGSRSALGAPTSREYPVKGGSLQRFAGGRIYWSRATGARELYGPILSSFRSRGGVTSGLGYPRTGIVKVTGGQRATFQHGTLTWSRTTGRVALRRG
jgi:stage II sporulation protein D